MMKNIFDEKEMKKLIDEIVESVAKSLNEAPPEGISQPQAQPQMKPKTVQKPVKKVVKPVAKPVAKPVVKKKPTSQTIIGPKDKPKIKPTSQTIPGPKDKIVQQPQVEPEKESKPLTKLGYQIFNIKMRLGKLGLNDTLRRFAQSLHDFDINITKNSKDLNEIKSYLSPAQGNLVALKGALESLEAEFNELENLLENK